MTRNATLPLAAIAALVTALLVGSSVPAAAPAPAVGVPSADPSLWSTLRSAPEPAPRSGARILARGDEFEMIVPGMAVGGGGRSSGETATPIFFRGVNLGAGAPGHFPGEFAIGYEDYRRWIRFARDLHANSIRVYA
ncbi:MAG: hypothetical protein AAB011_14100, partial [Candidatus Eisenbacteria bacterium]